ncbi:helix-turn-helix domain-containing protein [Beduini massiliensis]|uniref:helix-turn-helix domain-containing protein n=1 Tax=Beduini massiliensis TaxID=1585974 RepID=UPI00059A8FF4|nr:helix-turn-helix transcriptional regulator [Beduini massiliensis]
MTNTELLKQCLREKHFTLQKLADQLNISVSALSRKINNKNEFKSIEINAIQQILKLSDKTRDIIFFATIVDLKSTNKGE